MVKYLLISFTVFTSFISYGQNLFNISLKNSTLVATDSLLPFWFYANQHGKVLEKTRFLNISDFEIGRPYQNEANSTFSYTWGGNLVAALGETKYYQVDQAFAGISIKGWEFKAGLFYDSMRLAGLSTTNGNLARSKNSRPYPMVRLSTLGYKPVPFLQNWLSFKAEYDEGILNDDRYVENTHLHHKSLYLLVQPATTWKVHAGFEHFVMWGGVSSDNNIGQMPKDLKAYLLYILGASGNEDFPETDQKNVAGNQLGTYQLEVVKTFPAIDVAFYLSHLFEDLSGVNWRNWPDNLLGIHFRFKGEQMLISDVVYEFIHTKHQSIRNDGDKEPDNYFNHGIYKSGFTYHQQMLGSPLFFPIIENKGIARGPGSNRFFAHHTGLKGNLTENFKWKGLITYIHHLGTYGNPYEVPHKQVSGLLEIQYLNSGFPVELGISAGVDAGNTINNNLGIQFWIAKSW